MAPLTAVTDNSGTTHSISNRPSASIAADNEDGEADHGTTTLAADVELSRNRRTFLLSAFLCNISFIHVTT